MIRFPILLIAVCSLSLAVGTSVQIYLSRKPQRPTYVADAPLSIRFVPETASGADSFVCIPDSDAPKNQPGMLCMTLDDFLQLRQDVNEARKPKADL